MDVVSAYELIECAAEKQLEDLLYQRWIAGPQYDMSFDEFRRALTPIKVKDEAEIIASTDAILAKFLEGRDSSGDF